MHMSMTQLMHYDCKYNTTGQDGTETKHNCNMLPCIKRTKALIDLSLHKTTTNTGLTTLQSELDIM